MNRWKAATTHLCISLLVIGSVIALVFHFWFPHALYRIAGLDRLFITMLGIDIVAGPILTSVIFKPGKPGLRRDLAIIGLIQLGFLGYGLHTTWASRPVLLVGAIDRLTLIFANEIRPQDLAQGRLPQTRILSWTGPRLVATLPPEDSAQREQLLMAAIAGGTDIDRLPKYYVPYPQAAAGLLRHATPVNARVTDAEVHATGTPRDRLRMLPVTSSRSNGMVLVEADSAAPLRVVLPDTDAGPATAAK